MNRSRQVLFNHTGIHMLYSLAKPRKLQPKPLLVIIVTHFLSRFMIVLFQILFKCFQHQRLLVFFRIKFKFTLPFFLERLFFIVTLLGFERLLLSFSENLLGGHKIILKILLHRVGKKSSKFILIGCYTHIEFFNISKRIV